MKMSSSWNSGIKDSIVQEEPAVSSHLTLHPSPFCNLITTDKIGMNGLILPH